MPTEETPVVQPTEPTITNPPTEGENPTEKRIKALSGKVESASRERDEAIAKAEAAERKANFANAFVDIISANPAAKDHKAEIEAKVLAGATAQDAMYAVLGPIGKLGNQNAQSMQPITGGSAPTLIQNGSQKSATDMNRDEIRSALLSAQDKGDFFLS